MFSEAAAKSWLVIFDPTLKSCAGHSYNYDFTVADQAKERFDRVVIYADEEFQAPGVRDITVKCIPQSLFLRVLRSVVGRILPRTDSAAAPNAPTAGVPQPLLRLWKNLRARGLAASLVRALRLLESSPGDRIHVFLQRADLYEIAGVDAFCARYTATTGKELTFHLLLRHDPAITRAEQESTEAFGARLSRLSTATNPDIRFHTDSEAIARAYRTLTGVEKQFTVVPIPVSRKASANTRIQTDRTTHLVRISILGSPRMEKGFGTLPTLIPLFPATFGDTPVHLAVQIDRRTADPSVVRVIRWLDAYAVRSPDNGPVLELLDGPAPEDVYFSWLARTDILVAPYISPKYATSTSGVFIEALHCGVPSVVMRGTWSSELIREAARRGLAIGEVVDCVEAIPECTRNICTRLAHYGLDVGTYVDEWKRKYSAGVAELLTADPRSA